MFQPFLKILLPDSDKEKALKKAIRAIIGEKPDNSSLYQLALIHASVGKSNAKTGFKESNERLEYLGDAVLGMVIAEYLFKKFPYKDEGFLTDIRSRIVNREALNQLAKRIGLSQLIEFETAHKRTLAGNSMHGDAMEALIGAIYLDKGFKFVKKFIYKRLLEPHYDLDTIIQTTTNYKSVIIEWAQKENQKLIWEMDEAGLHHAREFTAVIYLNDTDKILASGNGYSKKKAEQDAARKACELLKLN